MTSAILAFAIAAALCPALVVALRRSGVLDRPNARSSHVVPTPRGAGLAVAAGAIVAAAVSPALGTWRPALLAVPAAFGALGLVEDLRGVPSLGRLLAQGVLAAAALPLLLRSLTGPAPWRLLFAGGVLLWLVSYVNAFNFMDGINGISAAEAVVAGGAWWAIGHGQGVSALAYGGAIVVGAAAGFAPYNFPRARAFLGDVGSYFTGAWLGVLVVIGLRAGLPPEAVLGPVWVTLADTSWTIVCRVRRGETWHEAHRAHVYQQLVSAGWSHPATTAFVAAVAVACSALGAATLGGRAWSGRIAADVATGAVVLGYLLSPRIAGLRTGARATVDR